MFPGVEGSDWIDWYQVAIVHRRIYFAAYLCSRITSYCIPAFDRRIWPRIASGLGFKARLSGKAAHCLPPDRLLRTSRARRLLFSEVASKMPRAGRQSTLLGCLTVTFACPNCTSTQSMDDQCPVCKSDRYLNTKLRLLVSSCYHKMCVPSYTFLVCWT